MAKYNPARRGLDEQDLEGGGAGASFGEKAGKVAGKAAEIAGITALGGYAVGLPATVAYKADKLQKEREEAAKTKREAKKEDSMTTGEKEALQEVQDEKMRQKMKTAPTTKTEMGKPFAGGGMTASSRADGIAQRGKTRGTIIR